MLSAEGAGAQRLQRLLSQEMREINRAVNEATVNTTAAAEMT